MRLCRCIFLLMLMIFSSLVMELLLVGNLNGRPKKESPVGDLSTFQNYADEIAPCPRSWPPPDEKR